MLFKLDILLKEKDYLAFNNFHSLESKYGKKHLRRNRTFFTVTILLLVILVFAVLGLSTFSVVYTILIVIFTALYLVFFKNIVKFNIKHTVKRLKKAGKLPFEAISSFEFYDDKFAEITTEKRSEQSYKTLERICLTDGYIFLYQNSLSAFILPVAQVEAQVDKNEFLTFITQKCSTVEQY